MEDRKKNYEELFSEAMERIPLYTGEWTNYNRSDPGITILQNFAAFAFLQQESVEAAADAAGKKLLTLAGFEERKTEAGRVYLKAEDGTRLALPSHKKTVCGDLCFETEAPVVLRGCIVKEVYRWDGSEFHGTGYLPSGEIPLPIAVFGEDPKPGAALYLTSSRLPPPGERLLLYADVCEAEGRNPFDSGHMPPFAQIRWQCLTGRGWADMKTEDGTAAFLKSGILSLIIPGQPRTYETKQGEAVCIIRGVLEKEQYDQTPRLLCLQEELFRAVQRDTQACVLKGKGGPTVSFHSEMTDFGCWFLLAREKKNGPYYRYEASDHDTGSGRCYRVVKRRPGSLTIRFYGEASFDEPDSLCLVCYTEEMAAKRELGQLYGCVDQEISLAGLEGIQKEGFCLLAEGRNEEGEEVCYLAWPGETAPDQISYRFLSEENRLVITDPGCAEGFRLYVAGACMTRGAGGNVRRDSHFQFLHPAGKKEEQLVFVNPGPGRGGTSPETPREEDNRFLRETRYSFTAVKEQDYENLVIRTPGLRIRKAGAALCRETNTVQITVMPDSEQPFPSLSSLYKKEILRYLEEGRLITTKIELCGPRYVPIHVQGTVLVRAGFTDCVEQIEKALREELDYKKPGRNFGGIIRLHTIAEAVQKLECVSLVKALDIRPGSGRGAVLEETDIRLEDDCLACPGECSITVIGL